MKIKVLLTFAFFCFLSTTTIIAQDSDGDGVDDITDLDDDNDGIVDSLECEVPVANYSFETPAFYAAADNWIPTTGNSGWGTHNVDANNYLATGGVPDGVQFLFLTSNSTTVPSSVVLNTFSKTFEIGTYTLTVSVGDGIADRPADNDGQSIIEIGYGTDALNFTPLAQTVIDGNTTIPGTWTDFNVSYNVAAGDPALGSGVLVRISHTGTSAPLTGNLANSGRGHYDNIRITKDTDSDGLPDCIDLDSDNDGCPDVDEAGFTNSGTDTLTGVGFDANGQVTGNADGYTITNGYVTDFINHCGDNNDFDNDGVLNAQDIDDDNDGIFDSLECDIPVTESNFENSVNLLAGWDPGTSTGVRGIETTFDGTNYSNSPEGMGYLILNDDIQITQITPGAAFEPADYIINLLVGDGLALDNSYRNDGQSIIEIGFDNGTGFQQLANNGSLTIEPYDTPNGSWTKFTFTATVNAGDPSLGFGILMRITHNSNAALLQSQGNYDQIRVTKDSNRDGIPDCFSLDFDGDGCPDVEEAGFTNSGSDTLSGGGIDPITGEVIGNADGYTGTTQAVLNNTINSCTVDLDFDNDSYNDDTDLDDDNDGILDVYECEIPIANFGFENDDLPTNPVADWRYTPGTNPDTYGIENPADIDGSNYNAAAEGNTYLLLNGDGSLTLNTVYATYEVGHYDLSIRVGDGLDFGDPYRNDGRSIIELGYHDGDYNNFQPITNGVLTVENYETSPGLWSEFTINGEVAAGDAALGQAISIRITHEGNIAANQLQGNYDWIVITKDSDGDGDADCIDRDSDNDGCSDTVETRHIEDGFGILQGTGIALDGTVTGYITGYLGSDNAVLDATVNQCIVSDTDTDGVEDGNYFYLNGGNLQFDIDEDNDNDGISDEDEGCNLTDGPNRGFYNFEFPGNDFATSGFTVPNTTYADFWEAPIGVGGGVHMVSAENYGAYDVNFDRDGTRLIDLPEPNQDNDSYLFLNETTSITQSTSAITIQEGSYLITIAIGDELDVENRFRNDNLSVIEAGYDNGGGFTPLGSLTVQGYETPNGTWKDFSFTATPTPASVGEDLLIRISHTNNSALNQSRGSYDHIRIKLDSDADGIPDCEDLDSDNDGCLDVTEAGFDQDLDGIFDGGVTVNANGEINGHSYVVDPINLQNTRTFSTPAVINNPLVNQTACEGDNAAFFLDASRAGTNPTIVYEWTISTDGGTTFNPLPETSNTLTLTGVVATDDGNIYRVRVMGDDNLCYEESQATLTITPGPTVPTLTPVNAAICEGANAEFTITGDAGAIVEYTINGGALQTATLDGSGLFTVTENAVTVDTTIELTSITNGSCTLALAPTLTETITVSAIPTITNAPTTCSADLSSYDVDITVSAGTIANPSAGTLVGNVVNGIPAGTNITIEVNNNGCTVVLPITAPNCSCPTVNQPINPVNAGVCQGNPNNPISVELDPMGAGDTINWYDAPTGGTLLGTGLSFTSTEILPGIYTYYAEAEEAVSGCVSSTRVQVVYSINSNVIADVIASPIEECDAYILPPLSAGNYYTGPGATGLLLNAGDAITTSQTIYIYAESGTTPNCTDESSFDVTIYQSPTLQFQSLICSADLATYTITLQPYTGTISSVTAGTIVDNLTVTNIPAGTGIEIFIENGTCTPSIFVQAPNCTCPVLDAPVNPQNGSNCEGEPTASIAVDIPTTGDSIDWYDAPTGGNLLVNGASSFTPTETLPGTYTYYAETVESISGCTSDTRTAVTLTIATQPTADNFADQLVCDSYVLPNLSANNTFRTETNGNGIQLNPGDVITTSQTIYVYAANAINANCFDESSFEVTITPGPEAPINPTNGFNCEGQPTAALSVEFPPSNGDTINWYDAQIGGNLIATGTAFIPTDNLAGVYTYYAENSDSTNPSCVSSRTAVTLTITATPTVDSSNDIEACEVYVLPNLSANNRYFTGPNGTGTQLFAGEEIITDQTIYIRAESAQNPDCSSESSFTIVILNEPVLLFPEILPLCADDLGTVDAIELGMDLGPGYRYDWTPNNDQNGDGVEEAVFVVTQPGTYSLRVYQTGTNGECGGSVAYTTEVVETLRPLNVEVDVTAEGYELNANNRVRVIVNDDNLLFDQFEYSLDNPDGPFQLQNYFENVVGGLHRVYVRGLQDCGGTISSDVFLIVNHPTFFTPNGDGINDTWNILGTENPNITDNVVIQIFDRHGKLMDQISPFGEGWDGTYNGSPMPASDYWFTVSYTDLLSGENVSFNGHFSLKR